MDIYIQRDDQVQGPFSQGVYHKKFELGELQPDDLVSMDQKTWYPVSRLADQAPVEEGRWKREHKCKKCGAPYKTFTLGWLKNSNVCDECIRKRNKAWSALDPYDRTPIEDRKDALRAVRIAGILYIILAAIDVVAGVIVDPILLGMAAILLLCNFFMWKMHSRIAVIILVVLAVAGNAVALLQGDLGPAPKLSILLMVLQFAITTKAAIAIFKLNKQFRVDML